MIPFRCRSSVSRAGRGRTAVPHDDHHRHLAPRTSGRVRRRRRVTPRAPLFATEVPSSSSLFRYGARRAPSRRLAARISPRSAVELRRGALPPLGRASPNDARLTRFFTTCSARAGDGTTSSGQLPLAVVDDQTTRGGWPSIRASTRTPTDSPIRPVAGPAAAHSRTTIVERRSNRRRTRGSDVD